MTTRVLGERVFLIFLIRQGKGFIGEVRFVFKCLYLPTDLRLETQYILAYLHRF